MNTKTIAIIGTIILFLSLFLNWFNVSLGPHVGGAMGNIYNPIFQQHLSLFSEYQGIIMLLLQGSNILTFTDIGSLMIFCILILYPIGLWIAIKSITKSRPKDYQGIIPIIIGLIVIGINALTKLSSPAGPWAILVAGVILSIAYFLSRHN